MKDASAFARKRKIRDKRNLRFLKNRHALALAVIAGGLLGGTVAMSASLAAVPYAVLVGATTAFFVASAAIARNWLR